MSTTASERSRQQVDHQSEVRPAGWLMAILVTIGVAHGWPGAVMWLILTVLIAVHEAGHALAAKRFRYPIEQVAVGVGPRLVTFIRDGVPLHLNLIPVIGWVMAEPREGRRYFHRRQFWFSAAGPIFSLAAAFALSMTAALVVRGPSALHPAHVAEEAAWVTEIAVATPAALVSPILDAISPAPEAVAEVPGSASSNDPASDEELFTVVGLAGTVSDDVEEHGLVIGLVWAAALSASIAGLNLMPAWGLDGYGIVRAVAGGLRNRWPSATVVVQVGTTVAGVILLAAVGATFLRVLLGDIADLVGR